MGRSISGLSITGVESLDQNILLSLVEKKALVNIDELPSDVGHANTVVNGDLSPVRYDSQFRENIYSANDQLVAGVYLNPPAMTTNIELNGLTTALFQQLNNSKVTLSDVERVHKIIKEIQLGKLYKLVLKVSKEKRVPINNSNPLRALLEHLAENFPPQNLFYTFMVMAGKVIEDAYYESLPVYKAKNFFTSKVGSYIQYVENRGMGLEKMLTLPTSIEASPFEAMFSHLYLNGHFNWNKVSTKEVVALWIEKAPLCESFYNSLTDENDDEYD